MIDSRGQQSKTLRFVTLGVGLLSVKFLLADLAIPTLGDIPPMTATEYGTAMAFILGIWLGREWTEKVKK